MFANKRLYNFAKVIQHEDNKVCQTNVETVIYEQFLINDLQFDAVKRNNNKNEWGLFCKFKIVTGDLLQLKMHLDITNLQTFFSFKIEESRKRITNHLPRERSNIQLYD